MDQITLSIARKVMQAIVLYRGPMDLDSVVGATMLATSEPKETVQKVMEFLQETRGVPSAPTTVPVVQGERPQTGLMVDEGPIDLAQELTYNYQVAKALLKNNLKGTLIDGEEVRKTLRTLSTFMESALKLQERLFNAQQMEKFQSAVLAEMDSIDRELRDRVLQRLLDADI